MADLGVMFRTRAREGCPVHPFRLAAIAIKNPQRLRIESARLPIGPVVRLLASRVVRQLAAMPARIHTAAIQNRHSPPIAPRRA
ncbi:hypothetical protein HC248_02458 [Polaromonas vacuolata]|uniref:Uncharacterized protein n=1 Tax=Polaromonas vacuolata TaxID=37448 RepID=A0A6H2HB88_9BURK|nr:hypothetical protein HC248_02458 [Polaromonas vacuolata]